MGLRIGRFARVGAVRGKPLQIGERRLVPIAWTLSVWLGPPRSSGGVGLTWTRPIAVEVTDSTGTRRVPIVDVGTRIMLGLMVVAALQTLRCVLLPRRRPSAGARRDPQ